MAKMIRRVILFLIVYGLIFWVGFRAGEISNRMRSFEKVVSQPQTFFLIEKHDYGNYSIVTFDEVSEVHPIIKFFNNKNLKDLLKLRDLQIYKSNGERVY